MKSKTRRIALNIVLLVMLFVLVLVLLGVMLIQREPDFYEDYGGEPSKEVVGASNRCTEKILAFQDPHARGEIIEFTEGEINGYIRHGFESRAEYLPDGCSSPQVRLRGGMVILAARVKGKLPVSSVVSIALEPVMRDGQLGARVVGLSTGSLPVGQALVSEYVRKIESKTVDLKGYRLDVLEGAVRLTKTTKGTQ